MVQSNVITQDSVLQFGKSIPTPGQQSIWTQQEIRVGRILYGFFAFQLKVKGTGDKQTVQVIIHMASKTNILDYITYAGYRKVYLENTNTYLLVKVEDNVISEVTADIIRVHCYEELKKHDSIQIVVGDKVFDFGKKLLDTVYLQFQDQIFNKNFLNF